MTRSPVHASVLAIVAALAAAVFFAAPPARSHESIDAQIERLTAAIAAAPDSALLYLERGEFFRIDGGLTAAAADFDRAARLDPDLPRLELCRAALALDLGSTGPALAAVDRFLRSMPGDRSGLMLRARVHDALGDAAAAAADQRQAAERSAPAPATSSPTAGAFLLRGPYLQIGTPTSIVVRWRTSPATDSRVLFGAAPNALGTSVSDAAIVTDHEVTLTGLLPDSRYYYAVGSSADTLAGGDASYTFRTSPAGGRPTKFWAIGDSGDPAFNKAVRNGWFRHSAGAMPDFWLMLGDNAYNSGTDSEYQTGVFNAFPTLLRASVLWPTLGNHDILYSAPANDYYDIFSMPTAGQAGGVPSGSEAYYSFDFGDIHFICLDSEGSDRTPAGPMLTWLSSDLAATTKDWTIAFWHHPPYTKGSHDSDNAAEFKMIQMRQNALPILEEGGVDLVLTGHSHSYERSMLLDQHYGLSSTLVDSMKLDSGNGRRTGDGAYFKPTTGHAAPHEGAVYAVAGSSSRLGGGPLNHPVMITSLNVLGSMVIEVDGLQLDAAFIDTLGTTRDDFTMIKGTPSGVSDHRYRGPTGAVLQPGAPNPFARRCRLTWSVTTAGPVEMSIFDARGRLVRRLLDDTRPAGEYHAIWDGTDDAGAPVAPGVYFARLRAAGAEHARKVVVSR